MQIAEYQSFTKQNQRGLFPKLEREEGFGKKTSTNTML
jgi:hypothetical protein